MALVRLVHQEQPLCCFTGPGCRGDLAQARIKPCKNDPFFNAIRQTCWLYRHGNKTLTLFLARIVRLILLHLIKTTFFTFAVLRSVSGLTQVSVGDHVSVVFTAGALDLLPVTMLCGRLAELHCVLVVTGLVAVQLTCGIRSQQCGCVQRIFKSSFSLKCPRSSWIHHYHKLDLYLYILLFRVFYLSRGCRV